MGSVSIYIARIVPLLLAVGILLGTKVWASPLFCGDEGIEAVSLLTGCRYDAEILEQMLKQTPPRHPGGSDRDDRPLAGAQPTPKPHATVLTIDPRTYLESEAEPADQPHRATDPQPILSNSGGDAELQEDVVGGFSSDDDWFYLHLDQEGTYLFFGDPEPVEEAAGGTSAEDQVPNQVGFGKRWYF